MNRVMLMGRLGMDPELRDTNSGSVLRMRIATSERWQDKSGERQERTEWSTVVFFGKRAEGLARHLSKGDMVAIEGKLRTSEYEKNGEKRYSTEIIGSEFHFTGGGGGQRSSGGGGGYGGKPAAQPTGGDYGDDDIPFGPVDERAH